jgi:hypothetical protein
MKATANVYQITFLIIGLVSLLLMIPSTQTIYERNPTQPSPSPSEPIDIPIATTAPTTVDSETTYSTIIKQVGSMLTVITDYQPYFTSSDIIITTKNSIASIKSTFDSKINSVIVPIISSISLVTTTLASNSYIALTTVIQTATIIASLAVFGIALGMRYADRIRRNMSYGISYLDVTEPTTILKLGANTGIEILDSIPSDAIQIMVNDQVFMITYTSSTNDVVNEKSVLLPLLPASETNLGLTNTETDPALPTISSTSSGVLKTDLGKAFQYYKLEDRIIIKNIGLNTMYMLPVNTSLIEINKPSTVVLFPNATITTVNVFESESSVQTMASWFANVAMFLLTSAIHP